MCFSATASFTAGAALLAVGAYTMRQISRPAELPYASIPGLFGVQQLVEGGLWLTLPDGNAHLNDILTHIYALFSHILWPIFVPVAVLKIEPEEWRRRLLWLFAIAGAAAGLYLAYFWLMDPTTSLVAGDHILYVSPHFFIGPILALYVVGTCGSPLVSSHLSVRWFGFSVSASLVAAYIFYAYWFISVWCFFAAIISVTILLHFRHRQRAPSMCQSSATV